LPASGLQYAGSIPGAMARVLPRTGDEVVYHRGRGEVVFGRVTDVIQTRGMVAEIEVELDREILRPTQAHATRTISFDALDRCSAGALRSQTEALWPRKEYLEVKAAQEGSSAGK